MTTVTSPRYWGVRHRSWRLSEEGRAGLFSLGWAGFAQLTGLTVRLVSNVWLARILSPNAYGILGSALAVLTTLEWLSDLGIQPALVRHPNGSKPSYLMTGWWMGLIRGLALAAVAAALAIPYSEFARLPQLAGILAVLAIRPALMALRSPGMPALRKALNYRALCFEEITMTAVGTVVSIALAITTRSIWSIVAGTLAGAAAAVIVSYLLCPQRPRAVWDREAAREIGHLGRQVLVNTLLMAFWINMDRLVGVRYVSLEQMGLYAVAWNLASVLEGLVTRACDIHFSMLARKADALTQTSWHRKVCHQFASTALPVGATAVVLSPLAIRSLYDARYSAAGPLFAILIARLMIRALGQVQFQYLLVRAEVHLATRAYGVALVVQILLFVLLVPGFGIYGLALSSLGSTASLTLVQTWLLSRRTGWGLGGYAATLVGMTAGLTVIAVTTHNP